MRATPHLDVASLDSHLRGCSLTTTRTYFYADFLARLYSCRMSSHAVQLVTRPIIPLALARTRVDPICTPYIAMLLLALAPLPKDWPSPVLCATVAFEDNR